MTPQAANRLRLMLAAGKHRLEEKDAREKESTRVARAEAVLEQYRQVHGPLTHKSPPGILALARLVAHDRAKLQLRARVAHGEARYQRWQRIKEIREHRAVAEEIPSDREERLKAIWGEVIADDELQHASQEERIAHSREHRVRGCGAAAKRAGFAE